MSERYIVRWEEVAVHNRILDQHDDNTPVGTFEACDRLNALETQVASLQADRERLDFLDRADGRTLEAIDYEHSVNARVSFRNAVDAVREKVEWIKAKEEKEGL